MDVTAWVWIHRLEGETDFLVLDKSLATFHPYGCTLKVPSDTPAAPPGIVLGETYGIHRSWNYSPDVYLGKCRNVDEDNGRWTFVFALDRSFIGGNPDPSKPPTQPVEEQVHWASEDPDMNKLLTMAKTATDPRILGTDPEEQAREERENQGL